MRDPYSVIISPEVTEKSVALARKLNKYTFRVAPDSTKIEVKQAVEKIFGVNVSKVNVMRMKPKPRRWRRFSPGKTSQWKKAIVTLPTGQKIEVFEGL